ncbi:hypothetical protein ZWY2020_037776, partial [Hordeum vulgare]
TAPGCCRPWRSRCAGPSLNFFRRPVIELFPQWCLSVKRAGLRSSCSLSCARSATHRPSESKTTSIADGPSPAWMGSRPTAWDSKDGRRFSRLISPLPDPALLHVVTISIPSKQRDALSSLSRPSCKNK